MKYRPDFPERFGAIEDAREHCGPFFDWYNNAHHHGGLEMLSPADVHHGHAVERVAARNAVLSSAFELHPERFVRGTSVAAQPPATVWINKPKPRAVAPPTSADEVRGAVARGDTQRSARAASAIAPKPAPAQAAHAVDSPDVDANDAVTRPQQPDHPADLPIAPDARKNDSKRIVSPLKHTEVSTEQELH